jgi:hypothetical protein
MIVRSYTRSRPNRPTIIDACLDLCADLKSEREWRALEAVEYALPVLERELGEIVERDVLDRVDAPEWQKQRMRETGF